MAYSLRLPEALDAAARARAEHIGISLNALVCVALDAYLRGPLDAAAGAASQPVARVEPGIAAGAGAERSEADEAPEPEVYQIPKHNPLGFTRKERREFERQQRLEQKRRS